MIVLNSKLRGQRDRWPTISLHNSLILQNWGKERAGIVQVRIQARAVAYSSIYDFGLNFITCCLRRRHVLVVNAEIIALTTSGSRVRLAPTDRRLRLAVPQIARLLSRLNPFVSECFVRSHAPLRIPAKHTTLKHPRSSFLNQTYSRHREMKSMKRLSLQRRAMARFLEPGFRLRPFVLVMQRGFPLESARQIERIIQCILAYL